MALRAQAAKPWLRRISACALQFLLGFIMSFARVFGTLSPFGLGMLARAGGGAAGLCV
jgi:hypothetical protein